MLSIPFFLAIPGLFQGVNSLNTPTRAHVRKVQAAAAPAIPTATLVSDFQKNNVSAKWAEGHPKVWGSEAKKFELSLPVGRSFGFDTTISPDEKFLVLMNETVAQVIKLETGAVVSTIERNVTAYSTQSAIVAAPGGQYDLIIVTDNYDYNAANTAQRLSQDGIPIGLPVARSGRFSSFDSTAFNGRHMLTQNKNVVYAYDLDSNSSLTLDQHTDSVMSEVYSPDGKYIATAAWDGYTKLWNASTGSLIQNIGPSGGQNWLALFSPDSKTLLYTIGNPKSLVKLYSTSNQTAEAATLGPYHNWVRKAAWSPNGKYLAIGGYGQIFIHKSSDLSVVQKWEMENTRDFEIAKLTWLDGGKKLAYRITAALEVYDFEKNLKYRWGPDDLDHYEGNWGITMTVKSRGWIGGLDSDNRVRFWAYPE